MIGCHARMFPAARLVVMIPILIVLVFFDVPAIAFVLIWFAMQAISGLLSLDHQADASGIARWAHIGGFAAGWLLAPLVRWPRRSYRAYHGDEGRNGFLPDGRRNGGRGPWD